MEKTKTKKPTKTKGKQPKSEEKNTKGMQRIGRNANTNQQQKNKVWEGTQNENHYNKNQGRDRKKQTFMTRQHRTNGQRTSTTATNKKEHKTAQANLGLRTQNNHMDKFTNRIGRDKLHEQQRLQVQTLKIVSDKASILNH